MLLPVAPISMLARLKPAMKSTSKGICGSGLRIREALRLLRRSKGGMFGAFVFVMLLILATFAPWIAPHDPLQQTLSDANTPPLWSDGGSNDYLIGTDTLGPRHSQPHHLRNPSLAWCGSRWRRNRHQSGNGNRSDRRLSRRHDRRRHRRFHQPDPVAAYLLFVVFFAAVVGRSLVNVILIFGFTSIPVFAV